MAIELGIIEKSGSWFYYGDKRLAQGKENARAVLEEDKELYKEIEQKVINSGDKLDLDMKEDEISGDDDDDAVFDVKFEDEDNA